MWLRLWLALGVTSVLSQYIDTSEQRVQQFSPGGQHQGDNGDVHEALQAHHFALEHGLHELNNQKANIYEIVNTTQIQAPPPSAQPVDIFLLQQPYTQTDHILQIPTTVQTIPNYNSEAYNVPSEQYFPVQIFKDYNCSDADMSEDLRDDLKKSKELFAELSSYDFRDINDFSTNSPQAYNTYKGTVKFRVEASEPDSRNNNLFYTTIETPTGVENTTLDGIDKLVASTQDLVSNEDLLSINNAAEKNVNEQSEDIKPQYSYNNNDVNSRNHITVKAKIENIVKHDDKSKQQILQPNSGIYEHTTPLSVSESSYNKFREQIVDNLVSTMVPYMTNGYQIVGVRETLEENNTNQSDDYDKIIDVTPRPVKQKYLAPITVALRLINANSTELFNTVDDYEASDSEIIAKTVNSPSKEKTTVEVHKSVPIDITHINDVEVHKYIDLDEGRNNDKGPLYHTKSLYTKYIAALRSSKKIQDNMNKLLYKYGTSRKQNDKNNSDQLEASENVQSEVEINVNEDSNTQRSEHVQYYDDYEDNNQKIIQPIIIEKEIPVTKFVDRIIEKKVPYPQPVEVQVPIDRPVPVAVPVEKIVEKPIEVTKYVDKPYPVEVPRPYPVEVKIPYPVEQRVYLDRPVHIPYPVEKVVEKQVIHPVPVPTPVGIPIEVPYPVEHKIVYPVAIDRPVPVPVEVEKPVEKIVHKEIPMPYFIEKKVPYPVHYETRVPVPYVFEKRIPVPVERIVDRPVTVTKFIEKPVHVQVPVPQPVAVPIQVPQPYPVEKIVEKKVPYPVPVDRVVEKPIRVPYPVEKVVEKIVEKPVVVTKYIDKPYPVETKVPYPLEKIVEKKVPYAIHVPVEVKVPYSVQKIVERPTRKPIPYAYSYSEINAESKQNPQYQNYKEDKQKRASQQQNHFSQYYQLLKEKEKLKQPIQSIHWGNQYASSYQYINNTSGNNQRDAQKLNNYITYVNNIQNKPNQYYGPVPMKNQEDWWQNNKNYVVEMKMSRSDREPKMSKVRIEYGGFNPPLIPSTEIDLDGNPIKKES